MKLINYFAFSFVIACSAKGPVSTINAVGIGNTNASNQFFGYFKAKGIEDLKAMQDHANIVFIETGINTGTASFEDLNNFEKIRTTGSPYQIVVGWSGFDTISREQGCNGNFCFRFNEAKMREQIQSIINGIVKPYGNRIAAFYIADEPVTNPEDVDALTKGIQLIKSYPELSQIPLWIDFDNIMPWSSGTDFVLPKGIDWVSLTPNYGSGFRENGRYDFLLNTIKAYNDSSSQKISLVIVGDGWSTESDVSYGGLSMVGKNHLDKIDTLYQYASQGAASRNIAVKGTLAFSWANIGGGYGIGSSHPSVIEKWKSFGRRLTNAQPPTSQQQPETQPSQPSNNPVVSTQSASAQSFIPGSFNLEAGQSKELSGGVKLFMQADGNFVFYDQNMKPLWNVAQGGACNTNCVATFQADGNFVLYNKQPSQWIPYWSTNTASRGKSLKINSQPPYFVIEDATGKQIYSSGEGSTPTTTQPVPSSTSPLAFQSAVGKTALWPAEKLLATDDNGCYSSNLTDRNNSSNEFVAAWFSNLVTLKQLEIYPRIVAGNVVNFPDVFNLYVTNPQNSNWVHVKTYQLSELQWNTNKYLFNLPQAYSTYGILIAPVSLIPEGSSHYFQICWMRGF